MCTLDWDGLKDGWRHQLECVVERLDRYMLPRFLEQAELRPISIDKVNLLSMWSLVTCVKDA